MRESTLMEYLLVGGLSFIAGMAVTSVFGLGSPGPLSVIVAPMVGSGVGASITAVAALAVVNKQLRDRDRRERAHRERAAAGARALLALDLSELLEYSDNCRNVI